MIAGVLTLVARGEKKEQPRSALPGRQGMPGMVMQTDSLMPMMRADLDSLAARSPQIAAGTLQAHEAMASRMLDAMGSDMGMMNMRPDSTWIALTDSVKHDLADLPTPSGRALARRLSALGDRTRRMPMHRARMHR